MKPFVNEPVLELRRSAVRESLVGALDELELPVRVPVLIDGAAGSAEGLVSTDPGSPERVVAEAGRAGPGDVAAAVDAAVSGAREWGARTAAQRAEVLTAAAERLRTRRPELAALQVRECAKPWPEADADVCEAIDFLEYYARGAIELEQGPELVQAPGERNTMAYRPRGVVGVVSPWNFPLAIPCGMTAGALAAGNAVVLKPAEQSPGCALALAQALLESGLPPAALGLVPGDGEAGAALVDDPRVHAIAFTGSAAVGLEIIRRAADTPEGQPHLKHVVAEMGGKNCVIVDADADLDEAVPGIVSSAFGFAGQKCSAASLVLAHEAVAEPLLERLRGAIDRLVVGQASELTTEVPPVIEEEARDRVMSYVEGAATKAQGPSGPGEGWFCPPTLAWDLPPDAPVLAEEVFGPMLCLVGVESVEEACRRVDSLPFALTGGLFSRDPATVAEVVSRTPVGNLYVNRATTGAMVGRQPFGGNRRSGVGAKAGGPDYLRQFCEPRVVSENTVRHGLAMG